MGQKAKHTYEELRQLQLLPLDAKIAMTRERIREWIREFGESGVYVSFSGGKDSTVLLHLVRTWYPDVKAVFVDTGLEYPEIRDFVRSFDNVEIIRPKMNFRHVIEKYGYPVIGKEAARCIYESKIGLARNDGSYKCRIERILCTGRIAEYKQKTGKKSRYDLSKWEPLLNVDFNISDFCCKEMKKKPAIEYERKSGANPILGTMAEESALRAERWIIHGCNEFNDKVQKSSNPMSFWTEQDILQYIVKNNIAIAPPYGEIVLKEETQLSFFDEPCQQCKLCTTGCTRTGCIFCGFGCHLEKGETRFQRLKRTHPKHYEYCIYGGAYDSDGFWKPDKNGLGMYHVFDELNKIYGENFIRYK